MYVNNLMFIFIRMRFTNKTTCFKHLNPGTSCQGIIVKHQQTYGIQNY